MNLLKTSIAMARFARMQIPRFHQVSNVRTLLTSSKLKCCCEPEPPKPACPPNVPESYYRMKKNQERFKRTDDGVPIFLKGGALDEVFYKITCVLAIVGIIAVLKMIIEIMFKL